MSPRSTWAVVGLSLCLLVLYSEFLLPYLYTLDWKEGMQLSSFLTSIHSLYSDHLCTPLSHQMAAPCEGKCTRLLAIADPQLQGFKNELSGPIGWLTRWVCEHLCTCLPAARVTHET